MNLVYLDNFDDDVSELSETKEEIEFDCVDLALFKTTSDWKFSKTKQYLENNDEHFVTFQVGFKMKVWVVDPSCLVCDLFKEECVNALSIVH